MSDSGKLEGRNIQLDGMNINTIAKHAFVYAEKRAAKEGLEDPRDVMGMCSHARSELFEVAEAYLRVKACSLTCCDDVELKKYKEAFADEIADVIMCMLIVAKGQHIDVKKALACCLEKNRKRAEIGCK